MTESARVLRLGGFKAGETCLYCTNCDYQTFQHQAQKPKCPECREYLRYWKVMQNSPATTYVSLADYSQLNPMNYETGEYEGFAVQIKGEG